MIAGLFITLFYNSAQVRQLVTSRDEERFDRTVARLGSQNPSERLTGLSGLQLFLGPDQRSKHGPALLFLANAIAIEKDPTVRGAMLDAFAALKRYHIEQSVLNDTLTAERDRNRSILKRLQAEFQDKLKQNTGSMFEKGNDEIGLGARPASDLEPLQATANAIALLVRAGAHISDLSEIYCVSCLFSSASDPSNLSSTNLDRSYLRRANFTSANLEKSSFDSADLIWTDFTGANLRGAKLTEPPLIDTPIQAILIQKALWVAESPNL